MCGIAGIFNRDGNTPSPVILKRMTDAIAHRGPDGEGAYTDGPIGLGHRRLAIIDLSPAGHQPMITLDGRFAITYNGEVYNFQELRLELESIGHQFRSRTDSEVVLNAFAEWGVQALSKFNGMFAFAIWDRKEKCLYLARDRYGIKPLYYTQQGNVFLFASEIKSIIVHPAYRIDLDRKALLEYFTFQNFFDSRTFFKDVEILLPGTYLSIPRKPGPIPMIQRYWDYHFREPVQPAAEEEYSEELVRLINTAVSRQLVSDVPVSSYLSGGMDSGTITAIAADQIPNLRSFTIGFDLHSASGIEMGYDERVAAERMSYLYKTEHYEMVLKAGDMERAMQPLVWHLEEPRVGQSYPNYYAAQLAGKFCKVVLAGTGSDELFGGYPWRYYRAIVNNSFEEYIDKYYLYWQRLLPNKVIRSVFKPIWSDIESVWTRDIFRDIFTDHMSTLTRPEDYINHSLYFEAKTFLHGLLVVEDKVSMAHGLESRVPFLDNDLVDFAMTVPVKMKLREIGEIVRLNENEPGSKTSKYFSKTNDGKLLLRRAMENFVPKDITDGDKQGFSAPDASWFRGESIDYVRDVLLNKRAHLYDFMDADSIQNLVTEHLDGRHNRRLLIWSLLCMEEWCKQFLGESRRQNA
jgi:asparagine synthase (glutamine-hydrolysing)